LRSRPLDNLEPGAGQGLGDQARIVRGGGERAPLIGALTDHEGEPILHKDSRGVTDNGRQREGSKNDSTFQGKHDSGPSSTHFCGIMPSE
jgi:hypothetical protein